jgi:hypothetical protein
MPTLPSELLYLLAALVIGVVLYRYFTGHGGIEIRRGDYAGLPEDGAVEVHGSRLRWRLTEGDSFVAGWELSSGNVVVLRVVFDVVDDDDPDLGYVDVDIDGRKRVSAASWTDKILDRSLRSDVEAVLRTLMREAKVARSDATRLAGARSVGDDRGSDSDAT